nr:hypothetical protein [Tanacetum cinerariifolium]
MNYYEPNPCYDSFGFDQFQPSQSVINHLNLQQRINDSMIELRETFQAWLQQRQDQVGNIDSYSPEPSQCRKIPNYYDDKDDEESSTPLRDIIIFKLPSCIKITPVLSIEEPKGSLIMGDEHLDTIPKKESDEFIKSSVENLVPNPKPNSEYSDAIIESFSPSPILVEDSDILIEEVDLFFTPDDSMPSGIENDDYDSEWDIFFLEELLSNDSLSLPENESFYFDVPSSPLPLVKPSDDDEIEPDTGLLTTKVVGHISEHYVLIPRFCPPNPPFVQ